MQAHNLHFFLIYTSLQPLDTYSPYLATFVPLNINIVKVLRILAIQNYWKIQQTCKTVLSYLVNRTWLVGCMTKNSVVFDRRQVPLYHIMDLVHFDTTSGILIILYKGATMTPSITLAKEVKPDLQININIK